MQEAEGIAAVGKAEADAIRAKGLAEAEGINAKAEAMKKYGEAAVLEMYFKALPEVVKNAAAPLENVDRITMYGDGNSSRMVGDIISSTKKVTDGLSEATGVDIRGILSGFLGGRAVSAPEESAEAVTDDIPADESGTADTFSDENEFMEEIPEAPATDSENNDTEE